MILKLSALIVPALFLMTSSCSHQSYSRNEFKNMNLEKIIQSPHRSVKNKARDQYRNPLETLKFFGLKPDMTVVEVSPGRGWYTEIVGPYLKEEGELYLTLFSDKSKRSYALDLNKSSRKLISNKNLFGKVNLTTLEAPKDFGPIAPDASVDLIMTFRNVHSWESTGHGKDAFKAFYKALKVGGTLGVVAHRYPANKRRDKTTKTGYLSQTEVIKIAKSAGFKLVDTSEINANSKDSAAHPNGVWTLMPSLRIKGEANKAKYAKIGESDRMTLKFVKL